ncbi:hypothetical protein [Mucilaginibacter celer]|uniref:Uncharacterized protein n=1 Tax=Mucilaginibacter celer TaxID=2305508 RepID=A0A494VQ67_9SPHI|nr:hypothetical protein [Mucilaginibacter celer]AYL97666.1 hypothetical protein HYN43_021265 [Mucilaginibacter celer]
MTTLTIDIPDNNIEEALILLAKLGVQVRQSNLLNLDELTERDYKRHFRYRANEMRENLAKYL